MSAELASLRVEHETLQARLRLSVEDLERRVEERRCALHEAEHICQERAKVIEDLENSNTALVRSRRGDYCLSTISVAL